jgi:hypothetical protein
MDISLTDLNSQAYTITNTSILLTFSNINTTFYTNLSCGYYNPSDGLWHLNADGGL